MAPSAPTSRTFFPCNLRCALALIAMSAGPAAADQADTPTRAGTDGCQPADALFSRTGGSESYLPPPPGLRFESGFKSYLAVVSTDPSGAVELATTAQQSVAWLNGLMPVRGSVNISKGSPLAQLWPLRKGKRAAIEERLGPSETIRHEFVVGDAAALPLADRSAKTPIIWIEDHVAPVGSDGGSAKATLTIAFAPSVGFGLVANVRGAIDDKTPLMPWLMQRVAQCPPAPALGYAQIEEMKTKARNGDHGAELAIGERLLFGDDALGRDPSVALTLLQRAADGGSARAAYDVGIARQMVGSLFDENLAVKAFERAAANNYAPAEAQLAFYAMVQSPDQAKAAKAFRFAQAAAAQGDRDGIAALGMLYMSGTGVGKDEHTAILKFRQAAALRSELAFLGLGMAYRDGVGVPVDNVAAYAYLSLAAYSPLYAAERHDAVKALDDLALVMQPSEIAAAEELADHWYPGAELAHPASAPSSGSTKVAAGIAGAAEKPGIAVDDPHPFELKTDHVQMTLLDDLSYSSTTEAEILVRKEAAVATVSQQKLFYKKGWTEVKIVEAFTRKPGDKKIPVEASQVYDQPLPGMTDTPMFDDMMQKVIVFPEVEQGDSIYYKIEMKSKPLLPGLFSFWSGFNPATPQHGIEFKLTAPAALSLKVENHEVEASERTVGSTREYVWRYASEGSGLDRQLAVAPQDELPRFFVSNQTDYAGLADLYRRASAGKAQVTPNIAAKAEELTAGLTDRRAEAEAIYRWVSRHIRYVGIWLGTAGLIPHDADAVLAAGYGDCKDHAVLFSALLHAKGIAAETVLVNSGNSYKLAEPPTFASLNHVITYLPEFDLYADTTARFAPFGVLPFDEYGKLGVHVSDRSNGIRRLPTLPPGAARVETQTTERLGADGVLSGETRTSAIGPYSIQLRAAMAAIEAAGAERVASAKLAQEANGGSGNFVATPPFDLATQYEVRSSFQLSPQLPLLEGRPLRLLPELSLGPLPGDQMAGPLFPGRLADDEPVPCFSGDAVQTVALELPAGYRPREVPRGASIDAGPIRYSSSWGLAGSLLTLRREFVSTAPGPVCIGALRTMIAGALDKVRDDYETVVELTGTRH